MWCPVRTPYLRHLFDEFVAVGRHQPDTVTLGAELAGRVQSVADGLASPVHHQETIVPVADRRVRAAPDARTGPQALDRWRTPCRLRQNTVRDTGEA